MSYIKMNIFAKGDDMYRIIDAVSDAIREKGDGECLSIDFDEMEDIVSENVRYCGITADLLTMHMMDLTPGEYLHFGVMNPSDCELGDIQIVSCFPYEEEHNGNDDVEFEHEDDFAPFVATRMVDEAMKTDILVVFHYNSLFFSTDFIASDDEDLWDGEGFLISPTEYDVKKFLESLTASICCDELPSKLYISTAHVD